MAERVCCFANENQFKFETAYLANVDSLIEKHMPFPLSQCSEKKDRARLRLSDFQTITFFFILATRLPRHYHLPCKVWKEKQYKEVSMLLFF
jgi:hypothetical protein